MKLVHPVILVAMTASVAALGSVSGPGAPSQDPPPAREDGAKDETKTLDELLRLESDDQSGGAEGAAKQEAAAALDRALAAQQISDAFRGAIRQMGLSASLLSEQFDAGVGTQRVQEEILRMLDDLIASAKKEKSDQPPSSSSSSSQQQNQNQARRQQENNAQQGPQDQQRNQNPADSSDTQLPTEQPEGDINSMIEEMGREWGALPPRIRDMLMQASRDNPSALYRRLTQEYYRRLAEEASN